MSSPRWARWDDGALLDLELRKLRLGRPRRPLLRRAMRRLERELQARDLRLRPHFWFSEEWFSPDGVPGIAIPFYLAHPRLERLERRMSGAVEGGNPTSLLRILRHEAGHAIDSAFRLRRRRLWRETFGSPAQPYPDRYRPDPRSRAFVRHLEGWYAQAHPAEDFAETFAVWLAPRSNWRRRYANTPALKKLLAMDRLMTGLAGCEPPIRSNRHIDTVSTSRLSLREYYRGTLQRLARADFSLVDRALVHPFGSRPASGQACRADSCLRAMRGELLGSSADPLSRYDDEQWLQLAIVRCSERRLWVRGSRAESRRAAQRLMRRLRRLSAERGRPQFTL